MLIPSLPSLSQPVGLPVCLARFPAAGLGLKDAVTRVKERPGFPSLEDTPIFPRPMSSLPRSSKTSKPRSLNLPSTPLKLLDLVALLVVKPQERLAAGQVGTVV